ncbi:MAG: Hypothetical protein BHV28_17300 [Candidatus Tokpelaia hoelldobleri]|uniref:Uncharacterized protein n=1 Tax=Candidatus Tokpelaia hoelldobleri TaxID=1902579 RepID=A0A1U9JX18_9HYPH|nr:MAG: Hypothetical protein BHV28_17300 [Candidatus Tokpelaia hoelldoblerii]
MKRGFLTAVLLSSIMSAPVYAQDFTINPAVPLAGSANITLNVGLLDTITAIKQQLGTLPEDLDLPEISPDSSIETISQALADNPQIMAVLQKNAISPHDYVTVYMTFADAFVAAEAAEEDQIFDETRIVSQENLEFGKKYAERIRKLLED